MKTTHKKEAKKELKRLTKLFSLMLFTIFVGMILDKTTSFEHTYWITLAVGYLHGWMYYRVFSKQPPKNSLASSHEENTEVKLLNMKNKLQKRMEGSISIRVDNLAIYNT